ncbi:MAG TPA: tetratricopeptide repeat protein [Candidatus Omnitrophota bacterium]|nr:tetratricopeptide repeat protein [Candidatus Omnitrophota bacterium]HQO37884.1 tetratricopeptide repeat protein [Candidatus Omnitrophota bacterium]HQQ06368.1 tetratricopeptide repeat protein [Candidatus Omnitrophota bacterium]
MLKKIALVFLGVFFWFVIMEAGMRATGVAMHAIMHSDARHPHDLSGEIRILCIGESTTQNEYPLVLQKILNARMKPLHVRVIDGGLAGCNSAWLLSRLPDYLNKFHPHIVVAMMGVNDDKIDTDISSLPGNWSGRALLYLRVCRLVRIVAFSASRKFKEYVPPAFGPRGADRLYRIGQRYFRHRRYDDARIYFARAAARDPWLYDAHLAECLCYRHLGADSKFEQGMTRIIQRWPERTEAYTHLADHYLCTGQDLDAQALLEQLVSDGKGDPSVFCQLGWAFKNRQIYAPALRSFVKAVASDPLNPMAYHGFASVYLELGEFDRAVSLFRKSVELDPYFNDGLIGCADAYIGIGQYEEAEKMLLKIVKQNPRSNIGYAHLVGLYTVWQKPAEREYYQSIVDTMRSGYYNPVTVRNYGRMRRLVQSRDILLVCVQYPLRSAAYLKRLFYPDADGVVFVDNKKIFQDAVAREGYSTYFVDRFAGDFGHLTGKGNNLLAENIADGLAGFMQSLRAGDNEYADR